MSHLQAIGRGLLVILGIGFFIGLIGLAVAYPWVGLPVITVAMAWFIGEGPESL